MPPGIYFTIKQFYWGGECRIWGVPAGFLLAGWDSSQGFTFPGLAYFSYTFSKDRAMMGMEPWRESTCLTGAVSQAVKWSWRWLSTSDGPVKANSIGDLQERTMSATAKSPFLPLKTQKLNHLGLSYEKACAKRRISGILCKIMTRQSAYVGLAVLALCGWPSLFSPKYKGCFGDNAICCVIKSRTLSGGRKAK